MTEIDVPEKFVPRATLEFHADLMNAIRKAEANSFITFDQKERVELLLLRLHSLPFEKDTIFHTGKISSNPLNSEITTFVFLSEYDIGEIQRSIIMPEPEGRVLIRILLSEKGIEFNLTTTEEGRISFIGFKYYNESGTDIDICYKNKDWYVKSSSKREWKEIIPTFLTTMEKVLEKLETDFAETLKIGDHLFD